MTTNADSGIERSTDFPHLSRAPIVEAVIEVRGTPDNPLSEDLVKSRLEGRLPEYPHIESRREFAQEIRFVEGKPAGEPLRDAGWKGLRLKSDDGKYIVQFNRDSFALSRLEPYENWDGLSAEFERLWRVYLDISKLVHVDRLGVRFINRLPVRPASLRLEDILVAFPRTPDGLADFPLQGFLHQETLEAPGKRYSVKITRTIQPSQAQDSSDGSIIIDVDVFTSQSMSDDVDAIRVRLSEMRVLKNRAFFGSLKPEAIEKLK